MKTAVTQSDIEGIFKHFPCSSDWWSTAFYSDHFIWCHSNWCHFIWCHFNWCHFIWCPRGHLNKSSSRNRSVSATCTCYVHVVYVMYIAAGIWWAFEFVEGVSILVYHQRGPTYKQCACVVFRFVLTLTFIISPGVVTEQPTADPQSSISHGESPTMTGVPEIGRSVTSNDNNLHQAKHLS